MNVTFKGINTNFYLHIPVVLRVKDYRSSYETTSQLALENEHRLQIVEVEELMSASDDDSPDPVDINWNRRNLRNNLNVKGNKPVLRVAQGTEKSKEFERGAFFGKGPNTIKPRIGQGPRQWDRSNVRTGHNFSGDPLGDRPDRMGIMESINQTRNMSLKDQLLFCEMMTHRVVFDQY